MKTISRQKILLQRNVSLDNFLTLVEKSPEDKKLYAKLLLEKNTRVMLTIYSDGVTTLKELNAWPQKEHQLEEITADRVATFITLLRNWEKSFNQKENN